MHAIISLLRLLAWESCFVEMTTESIFVSVVPFSLSLSFLASKHNFHSTGRLGRNSSVPALPCSQVSACDSSEIKCRKYNYMIAVLVNIAPFRHFQLFPSPSFCTTQSLITMNFSFEYKPKFKCCQLLLILLLNYHTPIRNHF